MSVNTFNELASHVGHDLECVIYGGRNVAIECLTCSEVLTDYEKGL